MKVVCTKCNSEYNIDPNRIPAHGITIKCPKCLNSFQVKKDGTVAGTSAPAAAPAPAAPRPPAPALGPAPAPAAPKPAAPAPAAPKKDPFSLDDILSQTLPDLDSMSTSLPPIPDLPDLPPSPASPTAKPPSAAARPAAAPPPKPAAPQPEDDKGAGLDFGMFDLGAGEKEIADAAVAATRPAGQEPAARPAAPPSAKAAAPAIDQSAKKVKRFKIRRRSGKVFGPFDTDTIVRMLVEHKLLGNEDASEDGSTWTPMGQVTEFSTAIKHLMEAPVETVPSAPAAPAAKGAPSKTEEKAKALRERIKIPRWALPAGIGGAVVVLGVVLMILGHGFLGYKVLLRILRGGPSAEERQVQTLAMTAFDNDVYGSQVAAAGQLAAFLQKSGDRDKTAGLLASVKLIFLQRYGLDQAQTDDLRQIIKELDKSDAAVPEALFARTVYYVLVDDPQKAALTMGRVGSSPALAALAQAIQALKQKNTAGAETYLQQVVSTRPTNAYALHTIGELRLAQNDPNGAEKWFSKALDASPGHLTSQIELAGIIISTPGGRDQAIGKLNAVAAAAPTLHPKEAARAQYMLGRAYMAKKMPKEALAQFKAAIAADPDDRSYQLTLGEFYLDNIEAEEAFVTFTKLVQKYPQDARAAIGMVRAMLAKRKIVEAQKKIAEVLGFSPTPEAQYYRGRVEEELEKFDDAAKTYAAVIAAKKDYLEPRLALARLHLRLNKDDEATAAIEEAKKLAPESDAVRNTRGELFIKIGKAAEAVEELKAAVASDPYFTDARFNLGRALIQAGQCKEAVPHLDTVVQQVEKYPYGHFTLAQAHHCLKDYGKAVAEYEIALKAGPNDPLVLTRAGQAYSEKGDSAKGIELIQAALVFDKTSGEANYQMGMAYRRKGDRENTIEAFKQAVTRKPKNGQYRFQYGQALIKTGMLPEAVEELKHAAEIEPQWAKIQFQLGRAYFLQHGYKAAIAAFTRSHQLDETRVKALYRIGNCYMEMKDYKSAIKVYGDIVKQHPDFVKGPYKLARAYDLAGKKNEAFAAYKKTIEVDKNNPMPHYYLGYIFKEKKDTRNAAKHFKQYLAIAPNGAYAGEMKEELDYLNQARDIEKDEAGGSKGTEDKDEE